MQYSIFMQKSPGWFPVFHWMDRVFIAKVMLFPQAGSIHLAMEDMSERSCLQLSIIETIRLVSSKKRDYYNSLLLSPGSRLWAYLWNQVKSKVSFLPLFCNHQILSYSKILTKQNKQGFANKGDFKQVVWRYCWFS